MNNVNITTIFTTLVDFHHVITSQLETHLNSFEQKATAFVSGKKIKEDYSNNIRVKLKVYP